MKEYLLLKWNHQCAYCGARDTPLEVEHIHPKSRGGSNRISNLTIACRNCNQKKSNQDIRDFLNAASNILRKVADQIFSNSDIAKLAFEIIKRGALTHPKRYDILVI